MMDEDDIASIFDTPLVYGVRSQPDRKCKRRSVVPEVQVQKRDRRRTLSPTKMQTVSTDNDQISPKKPMKRRSVGGGKNPVSAKTGRNKVLSPKGLIFVYQPPPSNLKPILRAARRLSRNAKQTLVRSKERRGKKKIRFAPKNPKEMLITPLPDKKKGKRRMPLSPLKPTIRPLPHLPIDPGVPNDGPEVITLESPSPEKPVKAKPFVMKSMERDYAPFTCLNNIGYEIDKIDHLLPLRQIDLSKPMAPSNGHFTQLLNYDDTRSLNESSHKNELSTLEVQTHVDNLATKYPSIPVHDLFNYFSDRVADSSFQEQPWSEVFRPRAISEFCGNDTAASVVKNWLSEWKDKLIKAKLAASERKGDVNVRRGGDSKQARKRRRRSVVESDSEDEDENRLPNPLILSGPCGAGKTSLIYAAAEELGLRVIELNSSDRRTGKSIHSKLYGATHTHRVIQNDSNESPASSPARQNGIMSFFSPRSVNINKKEESDDVPSLSRENSSENGTHSFSVILFDDVDVVFDDENGFWAAVQSFTSESRVPIALTCQDEQACMLGDESLIQSVNIERPSIEVAVPYFKLLCLAASSILIDSSRIKKLYREHNGNFRSMLLQVQFGFGYIAQPIDLPVSSKYNCLSVSQKSTWSEAAKLAEFLAFSDQIEALSNSNLPPRTSFRTRLLDGLVEAEGGEIVRKQTLVDIETPVDKLFIDCSVLKNLVEGLKAESLNYHLFVADTDILRLDYASYISQMCLSERQNEMISRMRRFFHYFKRFNIDPYGILERYFSKKLLS